MIGFCSFGDSLWDKSHSDPLIKFAKADGRLQRFCHHLRSDPEILDFSAIGLERTHFMLKLKNKGIQTQVHYIPVHLQPFFQEHFGTDIGDCPKAEAYYERCLSLPLYPALSDQEIERVIREVRMIVSAGTKDYGNPLRPY